MPEVTVPTDRVFPILKENILVDGFHVVIDLERSHGAVIIDALEGKEYLDCYGYFATLPVGHNHPKIVEAMARAGETVIHLDSTMLSPDVIELAERLCGLLPEPLGKVQFLNTGGEDIHGTVANRICGGGGEVPVAVVQEH